MHANTLLDPVHVLNNISPQLEAEYNVGIDLYEQDVKEPTKESVDAIRRNYMDSVTVYIGKIDESEIYRA